MISSVLTVAPLRISFVGGGTDISYFYKKYGGAVISCAINKYVYVHIKRHDESFGEKYRISYSKVEHPKSISEIKNNIVRESLRFLNFNEPVHISILSDLPAGTGLGSSSSFTVALLLGLHALRGEIPSKAQLANEACQIEIDILGQPIGKQDQFASAFGGLNFIEFFKTGKVVVSPINISQKYKKELFRNSALLWTGKRRDARDILESQYKLKLNNESRLKSILELTGNFRLLLEAESTINKVREIISDSWKIKRNLSPLIENKFISQQIKKLEKIHGIGIKLLGAGGGGFIYLLKEPSAEFETPGFKMIQPDIDEEGARVISRFN